MQLIASERNARGTAGTTADIPISVCAFWLSTFRPATVRPAQNGVIAKCVGLVPTGMLPVTWKAATSITQTAFDNRFVT